MIRNFSLLQASFDDAAALVFYHSQSEQTMTLAGFTARSDVATLDAHH